jgi:uncharacterized membrane protein
MTTVTFGLVSLVGATLGFRFNVMALFPAIGVALLYVACIEVGRGHGGGEVVLTMILTAAALQVGYLVGTVLRSIAIFSVAPAVRRILVQGR